MVKVWFGICFNQVSNFLQKKVRKLYIESLFNVQFTENRNNFLIKVWKYDMTWCQNVKWHPPRSKKSSNAKYYFYLTYFFKLQSQFVRTHVFILKFRCGHYWWLNSLIFTYFFMLIVLIYFKRIRFQFFCMHAARASNVNETGDDYE